jgi:hypothetical protein
MRDELPNNLAHLISAGIGPDDAIDIATRAAGRYDMNRKPYGKPSGALGSVGRHIYDHLARDGDGKRDAAGRDL